MLQSIPDKLILRCYGYQRDETKWVGVCLDLNLAIEAESVNKLKEKMNEVIESYIDTVLDTTDKASIPELLLRRAPIHDWVIYYFINLACFVKRIRGKFTFKEVIPFHLSHSC